MRRLMCLALLHTAVFCSFVALYGCALQSSAPPNSTARPSRASPDGWSYSQTITLDTTASGANVLEDVRQYPLAVLLDRSLFDFDQARADGADIRFFDSEGKALPHAIELWDKTAGSPVVWVLLDEVTGSNKGQSILMKWGHSGAPNISDSQAVFKRQDGFVGVWHLDEDGNTAPHGYRDPATTKHTARVWG